VCVRDRRWWGKPTFKKICGALAWRIRRLLGDPTVDRFLITAARRWRPLLTRPVFIGIIGSVGKTTAKELLLQLLFHQGRVSGSPASLNLLPEVAKTVLRVRPGQDFCVAELSEDQPGIVDQALVLLRPAIGIVTVVGKDHWSAYHSLEAIAAEMAKLVAALPAAGTAVLNADDPRVKGMAAQCAARIISYGLSADADLRAEEVRSVWPERLSFTLIYGAERIPVQTRLCGTHWMPTVLSALGGALAAGMSLADCVRRLAGCEPCDARMQPVALSDGVTFIRDDWKAPLWGIDAAFRFMETARAARKIIVVGEISDAGASKEVKYQRVAKRALAIADAVVFVGPWASCAFQAGALAEGKSLRVFTHVRDASAYLDAFLRAGDLVLLKGSNKRDHLQRIVLARRGKVACWRDDCVRIIQCSECSDLHTPSGLPLQLDPGPADGAVPAGETFGVDEQVIVGLGNPEPRYAGTPHNLGYETVDRLAAGLGLNWTAVAEGWIARGALQGQALCLVKINRPMNLIGPGLKRLSEGRGFGPEQCVLVFDDLALPLGTVRIRQSGSAGGHRGVASILEAFQSSAFRRIKIGVGTEASRRHAVKYVLTTFDPAARAELDQAIATAHQMIQALLQAPKKPERQPGRDEPSPGAAS
jgi:aminoacyl-tRNA hydrolase